MNIKKIPVELIDLEDRIRAVNDTYVAEIIASFEEKGGEGRGQITPIEVREAGENGRHRLVSGAHRLAAAQALGWKTVTASVIRCTNDEARLREIDENLIRHDLSSLDRAAFMVEREAVWVQMNPDSVRGRAGGLARHSATENFSFAKKTAEKLGLTDRTIRGWLKLGRVTAGLSGPLRARIAASDLAYNHSELIELANIEDEREREQVVELLLAGRKGAPKKVADALRQVKGLPAPEKNKDQADFDRFVILWTRCTAETQDNIRRFVKSQEGKGRQGKRRAGVQAT